MTDAQKKQIKDIIDIVIGYFKAIFAFWYPEESEELDSFIEELK